MKEISPNYASGKKAYNLLKFRKGDGASTVAQGGGALIMQSANTEGKSRAKKASWGRRLVWTARQSLGSQGNQRLYLSTKKQLLMDKRKRQLPVTKK